MSNIHNNKIPRDDCFATNLSKYSRAYQYFVSDEIGFSYGCTKSYMMD